MDIYSRMKDSGNPQSAAADGPPVLLRIIGFSMR